MTPVLSMEHSLTIKFDTLLPAGEIDAFDLTNSVAAFADGIRSIAEVQGMSSEKLRVRVRALREGSFNVDLAVLETTAAIAGAALPLVADPRNIDAIKRALITLTQLIELRKFLKGEKPKEIVINHNSGTAAVVRVNGDQNIINLVTFNALQDKTLNKCIRKAFSPLTKPETEVQQIELSGPEEISASVSKDDAPYFEPTEEIQSTPQQRIKGVVSALDRKTGNGKLTVGSRRINFELQVDVGQIDDIEAMVSALIDSMKHKKLIILTGEAIMDFEATIKNLRVPK